MAIQDKFNSKNVIYKITSDVDLEGGTLTVPAGCTLDFQGGSINNGTVRGNGAYVSGETSGCSAKFEDVVYFTSGQETALNGIVVEISNRMAEVEDRFNDSLDDMNLKINYIDDKAAKANSTASKAEAKADSAISTSNEAANTATIAKNAVATLEGLADADEAQQTLAAQVVQIEENKQNIALNKAETDEKLTELATEVEQKMDYELSTTDLQLQRGIAEGILPIDAKYSQNDNFNTYFFFVRKGYHLRVISNTVSCYCGFTKISPTLNESLLWSQYFEQGQVKDYDFTFDVDGYLGVAIRTTGVIPEAIIINEGSIAKNVEKLSEELVVVKEDIDDIIHSDEYSLPINAKSVAGIICAEGSTYLSNSRFTTDYIRVRKGHHYKITFCGGTRVAYSKNVPALNVTTEWSENLGSLNEVYNYDFIFDEDGYLGLSRNNSYMAEFLLINEQPINGAIEDIERNTFELDVNLSEEPYIIREHKSVNGIVVTSNVYGKYDEYVTDYIFVKAGYHVKIENTSSSNAAFTAHPPYLQAQIVKSFTFNTSAELRAYDFVFDEDGYLGVSRNNATEPRFVIKNDGLAIGMKKYNSESSISLLDFTVQQGVSDTHYIYTNLYKGEQIAMHVNCSYYMMSIAYYYLLPNNTTVLIGINDSFRDIVYTLPENAIGIGIYISGSKIRVTETLKLFVQKNQKGQIKENHINLNAGNNNLYTTIESYKEYSGDYNRYYFHLNPGEYDLMNEFTSDLINSANYDGINDYFAGLTLYNGMYLIGEGVKDQIIVKCEIPTSYDIEKRRMISTINLVGFCGVKNITFISKNIRYVCHDDFVKSMNAIHQIESSDFIGDNISNQNAYGAGTQGGLEVRLDSCACYPSIGFHSNSYSEGAKVILKNCLTPYIGVSDSAPKCKNEILFDSCKINNVVYSHNSTTDDRYKWEMSGFNTKSFVYSDNVQSIGFIDKIRDVSYQLGACISCNGNTAIGKHDLYGVVIGKDSEYSYVQYDGYIPLNLIGINDIVVGDYLKITDGVIAKAESGEDAIAVVCNYNNDIYHAKFI